MNLSILEKLIFTLTALLPMLATGLYADVVHRGHLDLADHPPAIVTKYRLVDIVDTKLEDSQLTNLPSRLGLSPLLNNQKQLVGNTIDGGFILLSDGSEYSPKINGIKIDLHSINNKGDLIVTLNRTADSQEWMVWPYNSSGYGALKLPIQTVDPFKQDVVFTGFNDNGTLIGYKKIKGKNQPYIWSKETGLQPMGASKGLEVIGIAKGINQKGSIVGLTEDAADPAPFFWHDQSGLQVLRKYRSTFVPKGWVEFADLVIADDDIVYGTFWVRDQAEEKQGAPRQYYGYSWDPNKGQLKMIDLKGMRLADVNSHHLLVGSLNGKAMIREPGKLPILLADQMDQNTLNGWELIEATSANDLGQIAGYGKFNGKAHIFLAEPTL